MVERVNFGAEDFGDDEFDQAKKIEAKDKKEADDKAEKTPRVSLDSLFERKKVEDDDEPKKLEDIFVSKKPEAEAEDEPGKDDEKSAAEQNDGALEVDHAEPAEPGTRAESSGEQLDDQPEIEPSEEVEVAKQMAEQHLGDLQNEQGNIKDPAEEDAVLSAAALTENLINKLDGAEEVNDELLDEALAETAAELELGVEESEPAETEPEQAEDIVSEVAEDADDAAASTPPTTPPTPPSGTPPPPSSPQNNPSSPPTPPIPPSGPPLPGGMPPSPPLPPLNPGFNPNLTPGAANQAPQSPVETVENRHSHAPYVLAGGVVGYLIGRRRGRIKTEAKLKPVQEKIEKEVNNLGDKLKEREDKIRALAISRHAEKPLDQAKVVESLNEKAEKRQEKRAQRPIIETTARQAAEVPSQETFRERPVAESLRAPETMTLAELLAVAGKVEFEHVSVKQMFESGRLDINGLRRVVKEYLQGGNFERELNRSLKIEQQSAGPEIMNQLPQENLQFDPSSQTLSLDSQKPDIEQLAQQRYGLQSTTPEIGNFGSGPTTVNTAPGKNKIAMAIGSTIAVVVLAVVVALILLAII